MVAKRRPPPMASGAATLPDRPRFILTLHHLLLAIPERYLSIYQISAPLTWMRLTRISTSDTLSQRPVGEQRCVSIDGYAEILPDCSSPQKEVADMPAFSPRDVVGFNRNRGVTAR